MKGCCECGIEPSGFIKRGEYVLASQGRFWYMELVS